jgi:hypothetical protein
VLERLPFNTATALTTAALTAIVLVAGLGRTASASPGRHAPHAGGVPRPDHVVVVMEENHGYSEIIGSSSAPYINSLASQGALFTASYAVEHPSQPNYLDFFSGGNQGVTDDSCPHTFSSQNLGSELIAAGLTFAGYSEDLPANGSTACSSGAYARKHNPWSNFTNVPAADNLTFTAFPSDYATLPALSFVIPNQLHDMHDGTIQQGDTWLQLQVGPYIQWTAAHNSLLILTWDEDDFTTSNRVATIFLGPMVRPGHYTETINHYNVLRTMEDMYDLPYAGASGTASTIADVWITGTLTTTPTPPATTTPTPTVFNSSTPTGSPTPTSTNTRISTATSTPAMTLTQTPVTTPTNSPVASITGSPVATDTPTDTPTVTSTSMSTATPTQSPCTAPFTDVQPGDYFYEAVSHLFCRGVISGYGDNTFRPYNYTTRGQLSKIVVLSQGWAIYTPTTPTFGDVPIDNAFYTFIETAYSHGVISGYSCGPTCLEFRPGSNATRGQISKIVFQAITP